MNIVLIVDVVCIVTFQIDVKLSVQYMSFSAHADAKGIMQLIRQVRTMNTVIFFVVTNKLRSQKPNCTSQT